MLTVLARKESVSRARFSELLCTQSIMGVQIHELNWTVCISHSDGFKSDIWPSAQVHLWKLTALIWLSERKLKVKILEWKEKTISRCTVSRPTFQMSNYTYSSVCLSAVRRRSPNTDADISASDSQQLYRNNIETRTTGPHIHNFTNFNPHFTF